MMDANESKPAAALGQNRLAGLLDRHARALELLARQYCGCPEDVVQESLVALCGLATAPDDAVGWLYTVVRRKAIDAARAQRRRRHHENHARRDGASWFVALPEDALDAQAAVAALAALPEEHREVIVARVWGGLTFAQIAQTLGTTDSTAQRRYEAALSLLREKMRIPCPNDR
jgi:RNA polymerase sigma-70 factor (ECF subfamily)